MINSLDTMSISISNNVQIEVINEERKILRKRIQVHNKATRGLVTGIFRYLMGHFTDTSCNQSPYYTSAAKYIPCYIGFGDGGIALDNGIPIIDENGIPTFDQTENWTETVDYNSTNLVREFDNSSRWKIRSTQNTLSNPATVDMDSIYYFCKIPPNALNSKYQNYPVSVSEIGLFANSVPNKDDLLAYIKLGNFEKTEEGLTTTETNTLYVRPADTIIIRWIITIAAIGKDSRLAIYQTDEYGRIIVDNTGTQNELNIIDVMATDKFGTVTMIDHDNNNSNG